jgi:hypothetical protein
MTINDFIAASGLIDEKELKRVVLFAFFYTRTTTQSEFVIEDVASWFGANHLSSPNLYRLRQQILASRDFAKGSAKKSFKLHARTLRDLDIQWPQLSATNEEVADTSSVLPGTLLAKTRGYIESIGAQINSSYSNNIFDGCAVLMRRLIEILLILSYEHTGIETQIKDANGNFKNLSDIIGHAQTSTVLKLSKETKSVVDQFRVLGNFSAHKIHYNCKRADLQKVVLEYRMSVEELLYKAGLKV